MKSQARNIDTNQSGIHQNLTKVVNKYLHSDSRKPFSEHTVQAFNQACEWLCGWQGELILDSCCGVGESTATLAGLYPESRVIGVDKSAARIGKHSVYANSQTNYLILRADLNDFWRLAVLNHWRLARHCLFYPNPYPKASQLQNRWYASAALPSLLKLGGLLEVRSNWQLYIDEFSLALQLAGIKAQTNQHLAPVPMTPFERKYWAGGQQSWQLLAQLNAK